MFVFWRKRQLEKIISILSDLQQGKRLLGRAVARSENPGGHVILGGDNVSPLVEIGSTDLPKSGGPPRCDRPEVIFTNFGILFLARFWYLIVLCATTNYANPPTLLRAAPSTLVGIVEISTCQGINDSRLSVVCEAF